MKPLFKRMHAQLRHAAIALLLLSAHAQGEMSPHAVEAQSLVTQGIALRQQGELQKSINTLTAATQAAGSPEQQARAGGELGISLLQARRYGPAETALRQAYLTSPPASNTLASGRTERARYAVYLGNLALIQKRDEDARRYYEEARTLAPDDLDTQLSVSLNQVRLLPEPERLAQLAALSQQLAKAASPFGLGRHHLNLGNQARQLGAGGLLLAYQHLNQALQGAKAQAEPRLTLEAQDALAQLYEDQQRGQEALALTLQGLDQAPPLLQKPVADLLINLEWRQGRLLRAEGKTAAALAAYQRAVALIESVRQDLPIEYEDGRSSFSATLEPVYLGYADLLLQQIDPQAIDPQSPGSPSPDSPAGSLQAARLRQAVQTVELIRQTELQDFLGERCAVEALADDKQGQLPPATAVLYPLVLPDRIELLLLTASGIARRTTAVTGTDLRTATSRLADALRNEEAGYLTQAKQLHDWLLKPFDGLITTQRIQSLIVVPDGALRLVPLAALHDGQQFTVEKYAVSMVTGMSMTRTAAPTAQQKASLVAGVSEPGPVVEKMSVLMSKSRALASAGDSTARRLKPADSLRAIRPARNAPASGSPASADMEALRNRLALPGVTDEFKALSGILPGQGLLNADFTLANFSQKIETGGYRIVHIASHGFFGGSADTSFIMAYDDLITMNGLQALLNTESFQKNPIELLTLSACQTAEGNERAPLGISGAAIKARAKSVLGTLWPVDDEGAQTLMKTLYQGMVGEQLSKTEALRQAQIQMIRSPKLSHPFYWAPFVLIGNWK